MSLVVDRWNELAEIKDELADRDWFMGTSGNLSIKVKDHPLEFLVTASGKDKRKRTNSDFLLVDHEGHPVEKEESKPSAETLLHCEVYNRVSAGCSLHVHTVANNVVSEIWGNHHEVVFKGQELIKAFDLWEEDAVLRIPIIPNHPHIPDLAEAFGEHIYSDRGAVLIRNHGITVWGRNGFEAKKLLEACEFLFQYQLSLMHAKNSLLNSTNI
ncbi:methylthioribulose 1-phosphate dehydratase [Falsibacillus albus]|uniref:Methylthioribulose-1-phosphate dehydratase n=1 Tax=Falsibacillus albus TaxID=2478915 RepID=A0A3L7K389_9BACI|nr:methylthioribulose 1-phosphate dehydratase [Falsibacillus albus]RLQ97105.1 methylthioribulose 1-phosphate dehydratase [Falsibacillus albus]